MPSIQELQEIVQNLRTRLTSMRAVRDIIPNADEQISAAEKELAEKEAELSIQTQGGAFVAGNVETQGGDFVGRDKIDAIINSRVFKVAGDANGNIVIIGDNNTVTPASDEVPRILLRRYYHALASECQRLPLALLGEQFAVPGAEQKLSLQSVYTDLDVIAPPRPEGDDPKELHSWGLRMSKGEGDQRTPLLQAIAGPSARKLVLLGEAGSGKTTFVNYISAVLAEPGDDDTLPEALRGLIPVRLLLRETARSMPLNSEPGQASFLWQALRVEISEVLGEEGAANLFPYWRDRILKDGALILLDGLDEVPETDGRRQCLLTAVREWAEILPENTRFLLTARPYAYADPGKHLPDFQAIALATFSQAQAAHFIDQWYLAVRPIMNWDTDTARGKADELSEVLERRPALADMASRPLLLTLMATLHTHRGKLPEDRADLYEGTVALLLERWQTQRQLKGVIEDGIERVLGLGKEKLRRAVETLAYETHERQGKDLEARNSETGQQAADIPFDHVLAVFSRQLPQGINATELVKYLEERAGLLISRREGIYAFVHRSFQEYLAGCYLANTQADVAAALKSKVTQDLGWWREVYLLAVGKVKQGGYAAAPNLLNRLVPDLPPKNAADLDYAFAVLALQSAFELRLPLEAENTQDAYYLSLLNRLRAWMVRLVELGKLTALERFEAANLLARLGDPRFDPHTLHLPRLYHEKPEPLLGFVKIPAGEFRMGSDDQDEQAYADEKPAHQLNLPEFYLARYPVTNAQYSHFVNEHGYENDQYWTPEGLAWRNGAEPDFTPIEVLEDKDVVKKYKEWILARKDRSRPYWWNDPQWSAPTRPVVGITWFETLAYCNWLTERLAILGQKQMKTPKLSQDARVFWELLASGRGKVGLPTEAQWEKAARGANGLRWPWGDEWKKGCANIDETGIKQTNPVGMFPKGKSPYGLLEMAGNTWEWTCSRWGMNVYNPDYRYPYQEDDDRNILSGTHARILRGGSWYLDSRDARCAPRDRYVPDHYYNLFGFRCVVSLAISDS